MRNFKVLISILQFPIFDTGLLPILIKDGEIEEEVDFEDLYILEETEADKLPKQRGLFMKLFLAWFNSTPMLIFICQCFVLFILVIMI